MIKYTQTRHGQIAYLDSVKGYTTVLLLHGWNSSPYVYNRLTKILSKEGYRVIRPWLPYSGNSFTPSRNFSYRDFIDTLYEFISEINIKNIHIFGHSFGGSVALGMGENRQGIVKSIIVADSPLKAKRYSLSKFISIGIFGLKDLYNDSVQINSTHRFNLKHGFHFIYEFRIKKLLSEINVDYQLINKNKTPILFLWGDNDSLFPISDYTDIISTLSHSTVLTFSGYHHWISKSLNEMSSNIIKFIKQHS